MRAKRESGEPPTAEDIATVRHFNRFYTRLLGLLDKGLLNSPFSLTEVRVLYELAHRPGRTAAELGRKLGVDAGYLSRILKKLKARKLIVRKQAERDGRQALLSLTPAGCKAFKPLDHASQIQVKGMLAPLTPWKRASLIAAMKTIERTLGEKPDSSHPYILRPHRIGDIGWITYRQGVLYNQEYGWDETFEGLVAEVIGKFAQNFDPKREGSWIAEREGEIVGSVFLACHSDSVAKLRLLYVEPSARGLGIGNRLVEECIKFARAKGYKKITLWTNDVLVSARRIYEAHGFKLLKEESHHSFGKDLVGQDWDLDL